MDMPTDEQMPSAIAELMGWEKVHDSCHGCFTGKGLIAHVNPVYTESTLGAFRPMTDRNHSAIVLNHLRELGLNWQAFLDPANETRHAWKLLNEYHQRKD